MEEWCIGWKVGWVKGTVNVLVYCSSTGKADYTKSADQQLHKERMQSMKQEVF
jgi:hypothetical protein